MLKLRVLTALILIPLVIGGIFVLPRPLFALITALIIAIAAWEWAGFMVGWEKLQWRFFYVIVVLLALILSLEFLPAWLVIAMGAGWWLIALAWIIWIEKTKQLPQMPRWFIGCLGLLVLVSCWESLVVLHLVPKWLLLMLSIVWLTDTAAYFGGRWWGKRKLAPTLSPNKTIEGAYTALLMVVSVVLVKELYLPSPVEHLINWTSLVFSTAIAAMIGDLFESLLKRQCGIKDSGQLLPGHGGILDRIDSLIAAAPVFVCGALALGVLK